MIPPDPAAVSTRQLCTKERPMPKGAPGMWQHSDAKSLYEEFNGLSGGGDYERFECPHCGLRFYVELPD